MEGFRSLKIALALTLTLGQLSWAGRHEPPPLPFSDCAKHLVKDDFGLASSEKILSQVTKATQVTVTLPYYITKAYKVRLVKLKDQLVPEATSYLSHSDGAQVIPSNVHLESWHNLIQNINGFHFTLGFKSPKARKAFINRLLAESGYSNMNEVVTTFEGKLDVARETQFVTALTADQYLLAKKVFAQKVRKAKSLESTSVARLKKMSDFSELTAGGTRYFIKNGKAIGFVQNGRAFLFEKKILSVPAVNVASHFEILKKQGRVSQQPPLNPTQQFSYGRNRMEEAHSKLKANRPDLLDEITLLETRSDLNSSNLLVSLNTIGYPWLSSLVPQFGFLAETRFKLLNLLISKLPDKRLPLYDELGRVSLDPRTLSTGKADSHRFIRFVWFKDASVSKVGAPNDLVFTDGNLLHDQMIHLAYGKALARNSDFVEKYLRGGVLRIQYNAKGQAAQIDYIDRKMFTLEAGGVELSRTEIEQLDQNLNYYLGIDR